MAGYIGSKSSVTQVDGYNKTEADAEFLNDPASVITVAGSNVGIGTSLPSALLEVSANTGAAIKITSTDTTIVAGETIGSIRFESNDSSGTPPHTSGQIDVIAEDGFGRGAMAFSTGRNLDFQEAMRLTSAGNLLAGKTSLDNTTAGHRFDASGFMSHVRDGNLVALYNRLTSDGPIMDFRKDGSSIGSIGSRSAGSGSVLVITFDEGSGGVGLSGTTSSYNAILPSENGSLSDNVVDLGHTSYRFDDIYATNGTIQTSDRNEKQDIEVLTAAETAVAVACKGLLRKFRWIDSVTEKGDDARIHFGIIAQDLQDAFTAEGLDAGRYAMFISSTWWETQTDVPAVVAVDEVLDEDGNVVTEAVEAKDAYTRTDTFDTLAEAPEGATERTRLGVRYPELLAFIIGAM